MSESPAADLIREARRRTGMLQGDLARKAGMPHSVVSAIEHGRRDPGVTTLARLLRAAGFGLAIRRHPTQPPDPVRCGRDLADVLALADALPQRTHGKLEYPRFPRPGHDTARQEDPQPASAPRRR